MKFVLALFGGSIGLISQPVVAQVKKPIVAVAEMSDQSGQDMARDVTSQIGSAISQSGRFTVVERKLGRLVGEQALAKDGLVTTNTPDQVGGFEGVDYLIYGTVYQPSVRYASNFGSSLISSLTTGGRGQSCYTGIGTIQVDLKIVEADTGIVKQTTRVDAQVQTQPYCNGVRPEVNKSMLVSAASTKVAAALVTSIYPIQVAAVQGDGQIVLNYGEGTFSLNEVLVVFQKGAEIKDPISGEVIGTDETRLGLIKVTELLPRLSKAVPLSGFTTAPPVGAVVRAATALDIKNWKKAKGK
jgi:curli biogenesis system outer membrane secretion channel CsgG